MLEEHAIFSCSERYRRAPDHGHFGSERRVGTVQTKSLITGNATEVEPAVAVGITSEP